MANTLRGEAQFTHDGQHYKLAVDMDVLLNAEDETGVGILELVSFNRLGWLATMLRFALAAGGGKLLSRKEAAELITLSDDARNALKQAFNDAMPQDDAKQSDQQSAEGKA